jgi:chromosome segregation ATPase
MSKATSEAQTAPLSAQRVEELKKSVLAGVPLDRKEMTDLLAILDSYSSMRAENERLRAEFSTLKKAYDDECAWRGRGYRDLLTRAEKAEAENERLKRAAELALIAFNARTERMEKAEAQLAKQKEAIKLWQDRADELDKECREQFAQLEKQRPLVEAAMGARIGHGSKYPGAFFYRQPDIEAILRAALKYREERGK